MSYLFTFRRSLQIWNHSVFISMEDICYNTTIQYYNSTVFIDT